MSDIAEYLRAPFPSEDIEWRAGSTNKEKTRALALAYITSRAVMDRLDDVVGLGNWYDSYHPGPAGGVICSLSLYIDGQWITKEDGAENTEREPIKGGISDAFKRAAVKWGIGRYLYELPQQWVDAEPIGNSARLKGHPKLPEWALPEDEKGKTQKAQVEQPGNGNGHKPVDIALLRQSLEEQGIEKPRLFIAEVLGESPDKLENLDYAQKAIAQWADKYGHDSAIEALTALAEHKLEQETM